MANDLSDQVLLYLNSIIIVSGLLTTSTYPGVYTPQLSKSNGTSAQGSETGMDATGSHQQIAFRMCNALSFTCSLVAISMAFFLSYRIIAMRQYRVLENIGAHPWVGVVLTTALFFMMTSIVSALLALIFAAESLNYRGTFIGVATVASIAGLSLIIFFLCKAPPGSAKVKELNAIVEVELAEAVDAAETLTKAQKFLDVLLRRWFPAFPELGDPSIPVPDNQGGLLQRFLSAAHLAKDEAESKLDSALLKLCKALAQTIESEDDFDLRLLKWITDFCRTGMKLDGLPLVIHRWGPLSKVLRGDVSLDELQETIEVEKRTMGQGRYLGSSQEEEEAGSRFFPQVHFRAGQMLERPEVQLRKRRVSDMEALLVLVPRALREANYLRPIKRTPMEVGSSFEGRMEAGPSFGGQV